MSNNVVTVYHDGTAYVGLDHVKSSMRVEDGDFAEAQVYVVLFGSTSLSPVTIRPYHRATDVEEDYETVFYGLFLKDASEPEVCFSMTYDLRG